MSAELAEPRGGAKGNAIGHGMRRTPGRGSMSHRLDRVRQAVKDHKGERSTALLDHINVALLRSADGWLRQGASAGVDRVTWAAYGEGLEGKLRDLHDRIRRGSYRAQPSRRVYIPDPDGRERPLGIAALEDKIAQRALVEVLNACQKQRTERNTSSSLVAAAWRWVVTRPSSCSKATTLLVVPKSTPMAWIMRALRQRARVQARM